MSDELKKQLENMSIEQLYATYCQPQDAMVCPLLNDDIHVTSLTIFPVKGCMGFPVEVWPIHEAGLYLDRHWCVKSLGSGKYLNIAKNMDTIIIHPYVDLFNKFLILAAPGMSRNFIQPIYDNEFERIEGSLVHCVVMTGVSLGYTLEDCGDDAASWINEVLNMTDCRLLRQVQLRESKLSLACDSHVQIMNISSLVHLSDEIAKERGFQTTCLSELCLRFRANIVIGGLKKYEESRLEHLSIRGVKLKCGELVERCKAVNLDLERYEYETYPLKYLVKAGNGKAFFGLHTFVDSCTESTLIHVGDKVVVHSYKS